MVHELGVPSTLEGIVCVQVFKASRGYADYATFEVSGPFIDRACLSLGPLPDAYLRLCGLLSAQLVAIASGIAGHAVPFGARVEEAVERERVEFRFRSRPMALLVGWQETPVRQRVPLDAWDWVDLASEHRRGADLRDAVHLRLDRLAAALGLGLGELLEDRVAMHTFWIAPACSPVLVIRGMAGSAEAFVTSAASLPRAEVQEWVDRVSLLPPALSDAVSEPLRLLAASRAMERGWLRFTLGWAALERLGTELGARFDNEIEGEQRRCPSCGDRITDRKPTIRPRLEALMGALGMPEKEKLAAELSRINGLRGRTHRGAIPEGPDLVGPERLANAILRAVFEKPDKIPT